jgi:hypothetical protein
MTVQAEHLGEGLVEVAPDLQQIIEVAGAAERGNLGLISEVHGVVADVAVAAYKAGLFATALASEYYGSPEVAAERLAFQADLAGLELSHPDRFTTHSEEVTRLIDEVPSYLPIDDLNCSPPEGGFGAVQQRNWDSLTKDLLANLKLADDTVWSAVAGEMAFIYARQQKSRGVSGEDLANRAKAFAIKQQKIIREAVITGSFRQPDQDDHAYDHYLEDLSNAAMPVWIALTISLNAKNI